MNIYIYIYNTYIYNIFYTYIYIYYFKNYDSVWWLVVSYLLIRNVLVACGSMLGRG